MFDAGPDPKLLKHNAFKIGVDLARVDCFVLSHEHADHVDGAAALPRDVVCVVPYSMHRKSKVSKHFAELSSIPRTTEVAHNVLVLGQEPGPPWEQALAVQVTRRRAALIIGCGHPGAYRIVEKAVAELGVEVPLVIGGLHLLGDEATAKLELRALEALGVKEIVALHCTGEPKGFKGRVVEGYAGLTVNLYRETLNAYRYGRAFSTRSSSQLML